MKERIVSVDLVLLCYEFSVGIVKKFFDVGVVKR